MKTAKTVLSSAIAAAMLMIITVTSALAAPPVRIAVVPGGGSGMEQEVCDRISDRIQNNPSVEIGTVNPDWFAVVSIADKSDLMAQTTRVNGTITIKTRDGHVIDTISVQSNKQDFNTNPGVPAPMNKALVDSAVREVIGKLTERAVPPIESAVATEIETRDKIIQAHHLGDDDKYDEALEILMTITPKTPHFKGARELIAEFQMEQDALNLMNQAKANVKAGKSRQALAQLRAINKQSKRYRAAQGMIATLTRPVHTARRSSTPSTATNDQLKALAAQEHALNLQRSAIQAQKAALTRKAK